MPNSAAAKQRYVSQGEMAVGADDDVMLTAVLGSCVSVCLHDPVARVGGMNHILLPHICNSAIRPEQVAINSIEHVINALTKIGGRKCDFRAKVVGGAAMSAGLSSVGQDNAAVALRFLEREGIPVVAKSVGGTKARQVQFLPVSGKMRQKFVDADPMLDVAPAKAVAPVSDLELF